ncbi:WecB/TagA/CpsF family glycosyltransferase [Paenibacillus sp.]|uniref:WecB/TagA/CpsF family glycosyltransferase n=1 Tax=Paenibacillus sp. TaxID=58172 RepID=UPI002D3FEB1A|nr:WecB/TagA/CpsF family glycosyltransferase [Paenibacillus sp.]HZG84931.1 WecB/TagA/CpsF family glycosyltransferase [Paenibacillus sp.]
MRKHAKVGRIIKSDVTALSFRETVNEIVSWIQNKESNYVCVCNTHSLVTASNDEYFEMILNNAGICTPDGMPLVWALRLYGYKEQDRVDGPNLMLKLCEVAAQKKFKVYLYGGTTETLDRLTRKLIHQFGGIQIVGSYSPPFRQLTEEEEEQITEQINSAKPDLIFVSLGCPKQEKWMYSKSLKVKGIMIGVGAAFDFIIGNIKRPPQIFQRLGLEWFFRLVSEPKRLWKRYLYNNPVFIIRFLLTYRQNKRVTKLLMENSGINYCKDRGVGY